MNGELVRGPRAAAAPLSLRQRYGGGGLPPATRVGDRAVGPATDDDEEEDGEVVVRSWVHRKVKDPWVRGGVRVVRGGHVPRTRR